MKLPQSDWQALKHLPTTSDDWQTSSQADLVKQYRLKLDPALSDLPEPTVATPTEIAQQAQQLSEGDQPTAGKFSNQAGQDDEKDEDLSRDLNRVRSQKPSQQESQQGANSGMGLLTSRECIFEHC